MVRKRYAIMLLIISFCWGYQNRNEVVSSQENNRHQNREAVIEKLWVTLLADQKKLNLTLGEIKTANLFTSKKNDVLNLLNSIYQNSCENNFNMRTLSNDQQKRKRIFSKYSREITLFKKNKRSIRANLVRIREIKGCSTIMKKLAADHAVHIHKVRVEISNKRKSLR